MEERGGEEREREGRGAEVVAVMASECEGADMGGRWEVAVVTLLAGGRERLL